MLSVLFNKGIINGLKSYYGSVFKVNMQQVSQENEDNLKSEHKLEENTDFAEILFLEEINMSKKNEYVDKMKNVETDTRSIENQHNGNKNDITPNQCHKDKEIVQKHLSNTVEPFARKIKGAPSVQKNRNLRLNLNIFLS